MVVMLGRTFFGRGTDHQVQVFHGAFIAVEDQSRFQNVLGAMGQHPGFFVQVVTGINKTQVEKSHGLHGPGCCSDVSGNGRLV